MMLYASAESISISKMVSRGWNQIINNDQKINNKRLSMKKKGFVIWYSHVMDSINNMSQRCLMFDWMSSQIDHYFFTSQTITILFIPLITDIKYIEWFERKHSKMYSNNNNLTVGFEIFLNDLLEVSNDLDILKWAFSKINILKCTNNLAVKALSHDRIDFYKFIIFDGFVKKLDSYKWGLVFKNCENFEHFMNLYNLYRIENKGHNEIKQILRSCWRSYEENIECMRHDDPRITEFLTEILQCKIHCEVFRKYLLSKKINHLNWIVDGDTKHIDFDPIVFTDNSYFWVLCIKTKFIKLFDWLIKHKLFPPFNKCHLHWTIVLKTYSSELIDWWKKNFFDKYYNPKEFTDEYPFVIDSMNAGIWYLEENPNCEIPFFIDDRYYECLVHFSKVVPQHLKHNHFSSIHIDMLIRFADSNLFKIMIDVCKDDYWFECLISALMTKSFLVKKTAVEEFLSNTIILHLIQSKNQSKLSILLKYFQK